jgi:hypothetical protein
VQLFAACETVNVCPAIVSVPVRAAALFTATANATVPLPVPDAAPVSVSQGAFAVAVHAHVVAEAVTATEPAPPVSATFWLAGEIVNVHAGGGGAACVTVNVFPATAIVALRGLLPVLAATVNPTVPLPVPGVPPVRPIHGALVAAVHAQVFADAFTAIEPDPPTSAKLWVVGDIEKVHVGGGAAA